MKKIMKFKECNNKFLAGATAIALAAVIGATTLFTPVSNDNSNLPSYQDPEIVSEITDEETPLAKTTTKTTKKTTKKNVKLSKASTKTYTKKLATKKKTATKTSKKSTSTADTTTKVVTTTLTSTSEAYKKKVKYKAVTTTVATTVATTVTTVKKPVKTATTTVKTTAAAASSSSSATTLPNGTYDIQKYAPKADERIIKTFNQFGFKLILNSSVSYSGKCDIKNGNITMRRMDDAIYHELGHLLGFVAGNIDKSKDFVTVYNAEKSKYLGTNKAYVTQDSSEYFAESFRDYTTNASALKSKRPQTYDMIVKALSLVTDARIKQYCNMYKAAYWSK